MLELETKTHSRSQLTGSVSGTLAMRSRVQMGMSGVAVLLIISKPADVYRMVFI